MIACLAYAHDDGRYAGADPAIKAWFNQLASRKGACCSYADGESVADPDWIGKRSKDGEWHYQVKLDGQWIEVPDDAVITEPNRIGNTIVWPIRLQSGIVIRCFMPGAMG